MGSGSLAANKCYQHGIDGAYPKRWTERVRLLLHFTVAKLILGPHHCRRRRVFGALLSRGRRHERILRQHVRAFEGGGGAMCRWPQ